MKIIILGVNGLIGNGLFQYLKNKSNLDLFISFRNKKNFDSFFKNKQKYKSFLFNYENNIDILSSHISIIKPDIIINCIGITKHLAKLYSEKEIYKINSNFPYILKNFCNENNIRLIQVSTDCVFRGNKGNYDENYKPDADDIYGKSKALGEINDLKHLTIRTSTIGYENKTKHGLLEWFLNQNEKCRGYKNAYFSGLTVLELSNILYEYVIFDHSISGIYHISSSKISKYDLLVLLAKHFSKNIQIIPEYSFVIDRTLENTKFINKTNYKIKSWNQMINQIYNNNYYEK